jgi:hypothetical protein
MPVSRGHAVVLAVVVFDEVLVPWERVFLAGEVVPSGRLAGTLSVWERARAVADQADRAELIMGLAQTISDMNGITGVSHVRDKLSQVAVWAKMCRAGWEAALAHASVNEGGMVCPDDSYLYAAKAYGGHLYSEMTHRLHDVAGGLVITAPAIADLDNPVTGDYVRKYMRTMEGVSGEDRLRIFHIIRDLTADTYGGWDKVTNQVIGGGMHHQRMATLDAFDLATACVSESSGGDQLSVTGRAISYPTRAMSTTAGRASWTSGSALLASGISTTSTATPTSRCASSAPLDRRRNSTVPARYTATPQYSAVRPAVTWRCPSISSAMPSAPKTIPPTSGRCTEVYESRPRRTRASASASCSARPPVHPLPSNRH